MQRILRRASVSFALVASLLLVGCSRSDETSANRTSPALVLQLGHSGPVSALAFSPDGKTLASAGTDNTLRLWDAKSGAQEAMLAKNQLGIQYLEYSRDGAYLLSRSGDGSRLEGGIATVWDVKSRQAIRTWPMRRDENANGILAAAFSPDGKTIALANWVGNKANEIGQSQITLWDVASGKYLTTLATIKRRTRGMAFSHDEKLFAIVTENGSTLLYDLATRKLKRTFAREIDLPNHVRDSGLYSVAFSPDDKTLAAMGIHSAEMVAATMVWIWDVSSGKLKHVLGGAGIGGEFAFSRDGKTLVNAGSMLGGSAVIVWDVATGKDKHIFYGGAGSLVSIALAPDGKTLAIANSKQGEFDKIDMDDWNNWMGDIQMLDLTNGKVLRTIRNHEKIPIRVVTFSPDGKRFVTVSSDPAQKPDEPRRNVRLWNAQNAKLQATWRGNEPLAFSADGKTLATGDTIPHVKKKLNRKRIEPYWDQNTGSMKGDIEPASDDVIAMHDAATGKLQRYVHMPPQAIAFSPSGKLLAAQNRSGTLKIWELPGYKLRHTIKAFPTTPGMPIVFSSDGTMLATVGVLPGSDEGAIQLWNVQTGKLATTLKAGKLSAQSNSEDIASLVFADSGKTIIGRSMSGLFFWDVASGERLRAIKTAAYDEWHSVMEQSSDLEGRAPLAISPDEKIVAVETDEYAINLRDGQTGELLRELKGHENGILTLAFSPDGKTLLSGDNDGVLKFWNPQTGALLLTTMILSSENDKNGNLSTQWISFTPDGFYNGSVNAEKFIRWRVGEDLLPAAHTGSTRRRPDLIQRALR